MADDTDEPPVSKLTRSKQRWAREGRFLTGKASRPEEQRLPPGQHLTRDWPTLDLGLTPQISRERWAQYKGSRRIQLERLSFVREDAVNCWVDLAPVRLGQSLVSR